MAEGKVIIDGTATEDQTLNARDENIGDEDGLGEFHFEWKRGDQNITEAAGNESYTLTQADVGKRITVEVSYTDNHGKYEVLKSNATAQVANVNDPPTGSTKNSVSQKSKWV